MAYGWTAFAVTKWFHSSVVSHHTHTLYKCDTSGSRNDHQEQGLRLLAQQCCILDRTSRLPKHCWLHYITSIPQEQNRSRGCSVLLRTHDLVKIVQSAQASAICCSPPTPATSNESQPFPSPANNKMEKTVSKITKTRTTKNMCKSTIVRHT